MSLVEELKFEAEMNRGPGWDRKIAAMLTDYAYQRQGENLRGRDVQNTATDALILQIEKWIDAEETLEAVKALVSL